MVQILKNMLPMLATCFIAGVFLTILAPYGTQVYAPMFRAIYWIGLCLAGGLGATSFDLVEHISKFKFNAWQTALGQSFMATIAVSTIIIANAVLNQAMINAKDVLLILFYVWVISAVISAVGALLTRAQSNKGATPKRAALYERLPPHLRSAEIYALAGEDHYVRVITARGDELVLMRLSDAIKETHPLKGLSPHRSWWVAEAGVDKIKKSEIVLHSEQIVPISRNGMKLVRAAGWK